MVAPGGMHGCSGGTHVWLVWGACMVALGGGHAWDTMRYGDTINEWAVRILLECILVVDNVSFSMLITIVSAGNELKILACFM